jgi:hypothetical protein
MPASNPGLTPRTSTTATPAVDVYFNQLQRQNLTLNPNFETNATSWGVTGALSVGRSTAQFYEGTASLLITMNALPQSGTTSNGARMAVVAGANYTASGYMRDNNTAVQWKVGIAWYNAASGGSLISYSYGLDTTITSTGWTRLSVTATAPAGALGAQVVFVTSATGTPATSTTAYLDAVLFEQSSVLNAYYTGIAGVTTTPDSITVYRSVNGTTTQVRGAVLASVAGSYFVTDYEAPFGVTITYWAETFAAGTSLGVGDSSSTVLAVSQMWIHDPLDPTNNIAITLGGYDYATLGAKSFEGIQKGVRYNKSVVVGKTKPVLQFYGLKSIENAQFEVYTYDYADADMSNLLAVSPVCIRVPAAMVSLPPLMYGVVEGSANPETWRWESTDPLTRWSLTFNETDAPNTAIVFAVYSYAYWATRYSASTYASVNGVYGTNSYIYSIKNPPA